MLGYDLDTNQMPMGKISKKQIKRARKVLKELSKLVRKNESDKNKFIEASNRFYTWIPHKFMPKQAPGIIKTTEMIQSKYEMLERLSEIELTYSLLNEANDTKNPLDGLYSKLNATITPMKPKSTE